MRLQKVTRRELGIKAGDTTIRKALIEQGFSSQKPQVEASQKNPAQVSGFRSGWHALKKVQKSERPASSS
ncbi:winged helix-turn-helix domain-containing protein [Armatimonas sp.]|uniref:winged helix-turn-helix domain-containing protein n=1 Tax=Armatimonas sp. TaxID=1872638 RepID=UPI00286A92D7|nr:winged helix-turn-helix domain-containing protein [Armatimonas sp.]